MAYIYLITNKINQKQYVGKTEHNNIQDRWKEHCRDYKKPHIEKRPLYVAMQKYGIENFEISPIEEIVSPDVNLEERESYWIQYYDTYANGYNATLGGDGKRLLQYDTIYNLWQQGLNCRQISKKLNCDAGWVGVVLKNYNISAQEIQKRQAIQKSVVVKQIDKNTNQVIATFSSMREAAQNMIDNKYTNCKIGTGSTHISEVCSGKRKTFAGFKWEK